MKRVSSVLAALAVSGMMQGVHAEAGAASHWIGLEDRLNGFLVDLETGETWMTGACRKIVAVSQRDGDVWRSRTVEMVSVGRGMARLDQTFELDLTPGAPRITVINPDRGGRQSFEALSEPRCSAEAWCLALMLTPEC